VPAEKRPVDDPIVPPPLTDHVTAGCVASALPDWSSTVAVNCVVEPFRTVAEDGETLIELATCAPCTVRLTTADAFALPLVPVTVIEYAPAGTLEATVKVNVLCCVPLMEVSEKFAVTPVGRLVADRLTDGDGLETLVSITSVAALPP
jgi:hypothetical protein